LFVAPSASYVISEQWNASFSMPITGRWFDTTNGVNQRNLTIEPAAVVEYVIPSVWLGGAYSDAAARQPRNRFLRHGREKLVELVGSRLHPIPRRSFPQDGVALLIREIG
jgi:hypothetical protein